MRRSFSCHTVVTFECYNPTIVKQRTPNLIARQDPKNTNGIRILHRLQIGEVPIDMAIQDVLAQGFNNRRQGCDL
jgi:hypothetical protein